MSGTLLWLETYSGLGEGAKWATIPQLNQALPKRRATLLAVKSLQPPSPHFLFWGQVEPVGWRAVSAVSSVPEAGS